MSDAPLTQLGRYRIVAELGRGAMGLVYKAEDPLLNRTVAVKTILMSSDEHERAEYEARFLQEAQAAGGLNHPNIITIYDAGREGAVAYMAMELLEGVDLRELMQADRLPLALALELAAQLADGLGFAHQHGVVHRDIKPANIMVVRERHAKIMDFGIARMRLSDVKTQAGAMLGSPKYMSPEQVNGERADHRSDIYSLGVVVYEMVTGVPPFSAPDLAQLMYQVSTQPALPPSAIKASLPAMIDLIVAKALEKAPDVRYQNARELAADLRACQAQLEQGAGGAQGAADAAEVDFSLATTIVSPPPSAAGTEATRTMRMEATARSMGGGVQLPLSRRFDSSEAIPRLDEAAAGADEHRALTAIRAFLRDEHQRGFAIGIAAALTAAVIINIF